MRAVPFFFAICSHPSQDYLQPVRSQVGGSSAGPVLSMIALPILCAVVLRIGWSFAGLYGQDAHDYLHQAQAWHAWFLGGARPEGSLHPQLYPLLGGAIGLVTGDLMALRILSLGALIGVVMIVRSELLARDADRRVVDMYMIISLVASPFLLRQAMFAMSDLLCLFFIMLAYRMAVRFGDDGKNRRTFGVALCAGAALAVRFAAAPLAIAIGIHVLVSTIRQRAWKAALAGLAGKAVLAVAILVVLGKAGTRALHHPWIENWSVLNFFQRSFDTLDGTADYRWPNIVHAFFPIGHPGFLLMGVPLLFFFHREDLKARGARLAILMFALYACLSSVSRPRRRTRASLCRSRASASGRCRLGVSPKVSMRPAAPEGASGRSAGRGARHPRSPRASG